MLRYFLLGYVHKKSRPKSLSVSFIVLQLTYFCSAAETESFAKTAQKYGILAQGVSQSVRRLEKELGVSLFDRYANRIVLNERCVLSS